MNRATRCSVARCLRLIATDQFDEFTIKSLLIDLRFNVHANSIVREIADFVAHLEDRDRGLNHANIQRTVEEMRTAFESGGKIRIRPTFQARDILTDLIGALREAGFASNDLDALDARADDFTICVFSLIQGARFKGLPLQVEAFIMSSQEGQLQVGFQFRTTDLGVPGFGRPNVYLDAPLIDSKVKAPEAVRQARNATPDVVPVFEVIRDPSTQMSLRQVN